MICLTGALCFVFAVYETLEYLFCYNDEKKEQSKYMKLFKRAHQLARDHIYNRPTNTETTGLLSDNIPMQTFHTTDHSDISCSRSASGAGQSDGNTTIGGLGGSREHQDERSGDCTDGQGQRSNSDDSLLHIGSCDVEVHSSHDEEVSTNMSLSENDDFDTNSTEHTVIHDDTHSFMNNPDTQGEGQGHSISYTLAALQAKVMSKKQTKNGYTLLKDCSDESETEF